jgi:hypothetical protein
VSARILFNAASAASRFLGVEWTDKISHTNNVNGSRGGAGSAP